MNGSRGLTALVQLISSSGQAARGAAAQARPQAQVCGNRETKTETRKDPATHGHTKLFSLGQHSVCVFLHNMAPCESNHKQKQKNNLHRRRPIAVFFSLDSFLSRSAFLALL